MSFLRATCKQYQFVHKCRNCSRFFHEGEVCILRYPLHCPFCQLYCKNGMGDVMSSVEGMKVWFGISLLYVIFFPASSALSTMGRLVLRFSPPYCLSHWLLCHRQDHCSTRSPSPKRINCPDHIYKVPSCQMISLLLQLSQISS